MTTVFSGWLNGAIAWVEKELPVLAPAIDADIAAAKAHFQPLVDQITKAAETDAANLASTIQADGLKVIANAAAAFQGSGNVDDAVKAAIVGLQAAGKDVSNLSLAAVHHAVEAAQAVLPPVPSPSPVPQ
jgi:hypothetical protein